MARVDHAPVGVEHGERLERLYREQGDRMWRAVLAFAGDPEVASDAVAEAFAQAFRRGDAIRDPERWVWRTVFRVAAGELKARARTVPLEREGVYEWRSRRGSSLRHSPSSRRGNGEPVVLHHAAGYPIREVASILGSTPAAVKVHLMRGRRRLRSLLEESDA